MTLDDLLDTITQSAPYDWHKIASGPTYRGRFVTTQTFNPPRIDLEHYEHHNAASFIHNLDVTIAYGLDINDHDPDRKLDFGFTANFPDSSGSIYLLDVFYRGSLVYRETLLAVDGGRAILPVAHVRYPKKNIVTEPVTRDDAEYYATKQAVELARFVHHLSDHVEDFDSYLDRSGVIIE